MKPLIKRAAQFAAWAHASVNHRRKYTGQPYIVHPAEVALLVQRHSMHTPEMVAVAWLHDVLEDTPVPYAQLRQEFGEPIANMVDELTEKPPVVPANRATRKAAEALRLAGVSHSAKVVKLADLLSNSRSIVRHDPKFAQVYLREKAHLLAQALYLPEQPLWQQAWEVLMKNMPQQDIGTNTSQPLAPFGAKLAR